jgi:hypothetical protein
MFRVNSDRIFDKVEVVDRIGGFERLAGGLRDLVADGVSQIEPRIRRNIEARDARITRARQIVDSRAEAVGGVSGAAFFVPFTGTVSNQLIPRSMVKELLRLFNVQGDLDDCAGKLVSRYRNGFATAGLVAADVVKVVPLLGWLVGGLGAGLGGRNQTRKLGKDVIKLLQRWGLDETPTASEVCQVAGISM